MVVGKIDGNKIFLILSVNAYTDEKSIPRPELAILEGVRSVPPLVISVTLEIDLTTEGYTLN